MSCLAIDVDHGTTSYLPGDTVSGTVRWELEEGPQALEIRLFWYTRGKGTRDVSVEATERIDSPPASGRRAFRFTLPDAPYSFSGRLVSLVWAIEAVGLPGTEASRVELVMSPTGSEILLPEGPPPP